MNDRLIAAEFLVFYCVALFRLKPCRQVKNDLSGTIHSAGYKVLQSDCSAFVETFSTIDANKFPINKKNLFISKS